MAMSTATATWFTSIEVNPRIPVSTYPWALTHFFGLLWLVLGFLQIVPVRKAGLHLHRKFGYLAIAAFFMHMWASIYHLLFDEAQHIMINRFFYQCVFSSL